MASQPSQNQSAQRGPGRVVEPLTGPQHFSPPTARELRGQAVQRLQAGLFGIAAIVLIVGLANIINDRARQAELAAGHPAAGTNAATGNAAKTDPLADVGVVPATMPEDKPASPAASPSGSRH